MATPTMTGRAFDAEYDEAAWAAVEAAIADMVDLGDDCPRCGERHMDYLAWQDDGTVECGTCGMSYTPESAEG